MKLLGAHLPIGKGIHTIQKQMELLGTQTCGFFLKNQKTYSFTELSEKEATKFRQMVRDPSLLLPHGSYLVNLANPKGFKISRRCLVDDLIRCNKLGIEMYNIHPGSNVLKMNLEEALKEIAKNINEIMAEVPNVCICLENMAGQGNTCGRTFSELKTIIEKVHDKSRVGITLDTCHLFGAGYDIRSYESFEEVMQEFNDIVGLKYLKAMHINDSAAELNSRVDRHESIGKGKIGLEAFRYIMNSSYFDNIPLILETPRPELYLDEIKLLKSFIITN